METPRLAMGERVRGRPGRRGKYACAFRERIGNGLGTDWERIGNGLGTDWERIGNGLGTDWERIGNGERQHPYGCSRPNNVNKPFINRK